MNKGVLLREEVESNNSKDSNKFDSFLKNTKKFIAFTLAETLIVMGVIGIVAALTIPNLNSSTNNMEKVTKVKKIYAELTQAHERATAVYGPVETWFVNDSTSLAMQQRYINRITEFMKVQKTCLSSSDGVCMKGYPKDLHDSSWSNPVFKTYPSAIAASGFSYCDNYQDSWNKMCGNSPNGYCGYLMIDIDGPNKGKNVQGMDIFAFRVTRDGVLPNFCYDANGQPWNDFCVEECFRTGIGCSIWILNADNMDYIDANSSGKCNHSDKTLSTTVTSCK